MSIGRERLTLEESRSVALEAARTLLIEDGPQAMTLKAVAARIGKTHANLLHHFGSAAGLQSELARLISDRVTGEIARVVERERKGEADPREIVDRTFDAFGKEVAGQDHPGGERESLNPVLEAIHKLVDQIGTGHEDRPVHDHTLGLVLMALGDSLLGGPMAGALGLPRERAREIATQLLTPRRSD